MMCMFMSTSWQAGRWIKWWISCILYSNSRLKFYRTLTGASSLGGFHQARDLNLSPHKSLIFYYLRICVYYIRRPFGLLGINTDAFVFQSINKKRWHLGHLRFGDVQEYLLQPFILVKFAIAQCKNIQLQVKVVHSELYFTEMCCCLVSNTIDPIERLII